MNDELREQLADVQHAIWSHWMRYQFSCGQFGPDGAWHMPAFKAERWQRQMETPYAELTDKERESDRHQADKVLAVLGPELNRLRLLLSATMTAGVKATQRADAAEAIRKAAAQMPDPATHLASTAERLTAERDEWRRRSEELAATLERAYHEQDRILTAAHDRINAATARAEAAGQQLALVDRYGADQWERGWRFVDNRSQADGPLSFSAWLAQQSEVQP